MPFVTANIETEQETLQNLINSSPVARESAEDFNNQYKFRQKLAIIREESGLTAAELKKRSRMKKREISRIEDNKEISPSVVRLMKYLGSLGYELDIKKKDTETAL